MKKMMWIAALLAGAMMAQNGRLANGVYAIAASEAEAKSPVVQQFKGKAVVLDTAGFAPLLPAGKPRVNRDPRGSWLEVQLAPEAAQRLEDLTRSRVNQPIAVVVGGKILSAPTVRSVITDGKARVTPCSDESCESLLRELAK